MGKKNKGAEVLTQLIAEQAKRGCTFGHSVLISKTLCG